MLRTHSLLLVAALAGGLAGCPKSGKTLEMPSAEEGYGDPQVNFAQGVKILQSPDKQGNIDYETAYKWFEFATLADPSHSLAHYNAGWTSVQLGNLRQAEKHYSKSHDLNSNHKETVFNLGNVLARQGKGDEAVRLYKGYVERHPTDLEVRNNLIEALTQAEMYDDAVGEVREILLGRSISAKSSFRIGTKLARTLGVVDEVDVQPQV
ncbi:MAG: tetratricopeptide repeat protein [Myxococcota bacterium]|nr:tetratricopeptide repeat protein [Myxococcota bacterium]